MQVRFRTWDEEKNEYKLISIISNIEDYDVMYKLLYYMKEHNCEYAIELNEDNIVESSNIKMYSVIDVSLCISDYKGNLLPHIVVDLSEDF